ncbi:hypothetical protein Nepgr_024985 [Nepenthes gracilis]|uniref:RNase H type-1 domain-containing protein n=1 Tax=Nepenthes gracilis TaxID=150966 RepID=A0AAD3XZ48_NEPGR|nr:hypothetical protein Nepgr_024985 [Nepenthes gracilis]
MPRISAAVMVHKLGLDSGRKPVRQKRRNHSVEKLIAIREEVKKLLDARFIREVQYPDWLLNVVLPKEVLGFHRLPAGIEANLEKIKALADMAPLRLPKTSGDYFRRWRLCPLPREFGDKSPDPPLLASPKDGKELYLYLAISEVALSSVLVRQESDTQQPVYYPLKGILQKPDVLGRLVKWAIELGEFDIEFKPKPTIKAQALADFIVETTTPIQEEPPTENTEQPDEVPKWTLHVDGLSTDSGSGARVVLTTPDGSEVKYSLKLDFSATNNVAEYETLLAGLRLAKQCSAKRLVVYSDSELIVNQINGGFEANNPHLTKYLAKAKKVVRGFHKLTLVHVPRTEN